MDLVQPPVAAPERLVGPSDFCACCLLSVPASRSQSRRTSRPLEGATPPPSCEAAKCVGRDSTETKRVRDPYPPYPPPVSPLPRPRCDSLPVSPTAKVGARQRQVNRRDCQLFTFLPSLFPAGKNRFGCVQCSQRHAPTG